MSHEDHRYGAPASLGVALITVSDTRTEADDASGALARELLEKAGHAVRDYRIIKDEPALVAEAIRALRKRGDLRVIFLNGGTGISQRDRTYETVSSLLDRRLDGFGEIFRALSFQVIGPAAMLSRAVAGLAADKVVFSAPGSPDAVRLALERLILPELGHIISEIDKQPGPPEAVKVQGFRRRSSD
jgi:molybdenum cofactor biosynthesis protein B